MRLDSQHDLDIAEYVRLSTDPILQQSLRSSKICRYFHSAGSSCRPHQGSRTLAVRCKLQLMELYRIDFKVKLAMSTSWVFFYISKDTPNHHPPTLHNCRMIPFQIVYEEKSSFFYRINSERISIKSWCMNSSWLWLEALFPSFEAFCQNKAPGSSQKVGDTLPPELLHSDRWGMKIGAPFRATWYRKYGTAAPCFQHEEVRNHTHLASCLQQLVKSNAKSIF